MIPLFAIKFTATHDYLMAKLCYSIAGAEFYELLTDFMLIGQFMYALVLELCKFKSRKVLLCAGLMLGLSVFEGVSVAAILPILSLSNDGKI